MQKILELDAVDLINTKCGKAGGINGVVQWATLAESVDKQIVIGTEWGFGLKVAAKLHLGSAIKNANPVVEFIQKPPGYEVTVRGATRHCEERLDAGVCIHTRPNL